MQFKNVVKDRLYYDQWQYAVKFHLEEASALRDLNHETIDLIIEARKKWRQIRQQRWSTRSSILISGFPRRDISDECVHDLHCVADLLNHAAIPFKSVVSVNTMWVYTNDTNLLTQLQNLPCVNLPVFTRAVVQRPRDVVILKNPKHSQRSYFRNLKITEQEKRQLVNFLENCQQHVRISPGLWEWMDNRFMRTQDYFFVDHSTDTWLTMLALVRPGLIRKTMQIQQAK